MVGEIQDAVTTASIDGEMHAAVMQPAAPKRVAGVFGTAFLIVLGFAFFGGGLAVRSAITADPGDTVVIGTVVEISTSQNDDGQVHAPVVEYTDEATGQTFTATGQISTASRPRIGESREVAFPPGSPTAGKVIGQTWFAWIFILVGAVAALIGMSGLIKGLRSALFRPTPDDHNEGAISGASSSGPFETALPPAGWYPDPAAESGSRWFDGHNWTEHQQSETD